MFQLRFLVCDVRIDPERFEVFYFKIPINILRFCRFGQKIKTNNFS